MRILVGCLLFILVAGAGSYSYAQTTPVIIQGKVLLENNKPAEESTVILLSAVDSSSVKSDVCNSKGVYKFYVDPGRYLLLISHVGYAQQFSGIYKVTEDRDVIVPDITLVQTELKEIAVTARKTYIDVQPGKVVFNVQNNIVSQGLSVFDNLKVMPTVTVGSQGSISLIGRQNALIMLDGKPINLSGDNLTSFLQSMQSSNVQRIEALTSPSAKYEAGGAGVINIITKKGTRAGSNGVLTAGVGNGKYYKANTGISFNYGLSNMNIFGNYNYAADKTFRTFTTDRNIFYKGLQSNYNAVYYTTRQNISHTFRFGTDFYLSANHTLGFLVSGTLSNNEFAKNNSLKITNQSKLDSTIATMSDLNRDLHNLNYNINYNGKLDTLGQTISVDVSYNNYGRQSDEYITNHFYTAAWATYRPSIYLQNLSPSDIRNLASKIDYVKPFSKNTKLEAGLKYSWIKSNNNLIFGPRVAGVYQIDPRLSSLFVYTENINSGYVNYTSRMGKFNLVAGLRVEQTNSKGDSTNTIKIKKNYLDWFPQAQIRYYYNSGNYLTLSFNRSITRPEYDIINPFLYYVDLYDYRTGNPNLLPAYANNLELSHTHKSITAGLYATVTTNIYNFNALAQNDSSKVNITTKKNFGNLYIYGVRFSAANIELANWWSSSYFLDASYQRIKAYPENGNMDKGAQDIILSSSQNFTISNTWSAQLSGRYESPTFYVLSQFKANYRVDAGISKQVFNKKGTFKLSVTDIFRTERDLAYTNYQNLNLSILSRDEGRVVRFGFTYNFGNISLKGITKHVGNEDEQKRAGGVAGNATN